MTSLEKQEKKQHANPVHRCMGARARAPRPSNTSRAYAKLPLWCLARSARRSSLAHEQPRCNVLHAEAIMTHLATNTVPYPKHRRLSIPRLSHSKNSDDSNKSHETSELVTVQNCHQERRLQASHFNSDCESGLETLGISLAWKEPTIWMCRRPLLHRPYQHLEPKREQGDAEAQPRRDVYLRTAPASSRLAPSTDNVARPTEERDNGQRSESHNEPIWSAEALRSLDTSQPNSGLERILE